MTGRRESGSEEDDRNEGEEARREVVRRIERKEGER